MASDSLDRCADCGHAADLHDRRAQDPRCAASCEACPEVPCPDCAFPLSDHLSADEAEAHGIDPGLRDGRGCAVIIRAVGRLAVPVDSDPAVRPHRAWSGDHGLERLRGEQASRREW